MRCNVSARDESVSGQTGFCINDFRLLKLPRCRICIGVSCAFSYSALEGINFCRCSHVGAETQFDFSKVSLLFHSHAFSQCYKRGNMF